MTKEYISSDKQHTISSQTLQKCWQEEKQIVIDSFVYQVRKFTQWKNAFVLCPPFPRNEKEIKEFSKVDDIIMFPKL